MTDAKMKLLYCKMKYEDVSEPTHVLSVLSCLEISVEKSALRMPEV